MKKIRKTLVLHKEAILMLASTALDYIAAGMDPNGPVAPMVKDTADQLGCVLHNLKAGG